MNAKTRREERRKKEMMERRSTQDMAPGSVQGLSKKDRKNRGKGLGERTKHIPE